jgi:uncharacterized membrane protein YozB (DUF420 family)
MMVGRPMVEMSILIVATLSLTIELVVLGLLAFAYVLRGRKLYRQHGITMTAALVLHLITIFSWMIWSFMSYFYSGPVDYSNLLIIVTLLHATLGTIAAALGVWLVASWHLQVDIQKCFARKKIMLATITLWVTAIFLGIILYAAVISS